jgi:hypothetical protein
MRLTPRRGGLDSASLLFLSGDALMLGSGFGDCGDRTTVRSGRRARALRLERQRQSNFFCRMTPRTVRQEKNLKMEERERVCIWASLKVSTEYRVVYCVQVARGLSGIMSATCRRDLKFRLLRGLHSNELSSTLNHQVNTRIRMVLSRRPRCSSTQHQQAALNRPRARNSPGAEG